MGGREHISLMSVKSCVAHQSPRRAAVTGIVLYEDPRRAQSRESSIHAHSISPHRVGLSNGLSTRGEHRTPFRHPPQRSNGGEPHTLSKGELAVTYGHLTGHRPIRKPPNTHTPDHLCLSSGDSHTTDDGTHTVRHVVVVAPHMHLRRHIRADPSIHLQGSCFTCCAFCTQ